MESKTTSVTKDMIIADLLKVDEEIASILINNGMGCIFCPASLGETLEQACFVHGLEVNDILDQINEYLADKAADYAPDESQKVTE